MPKPKIVLPLLFIPLLTIAFLLRLHLAHSATFPGGGDYSFYYTVAKNLDAGRPFQIDYIWQYLNKPENITHSSLDFWAPLTSVLIFFSFRLLEQTTTAALVPAITAGCLLSVPTFFLSHYYTKSKLVRWASTILVLFLPSLFRLSLTTESGIFYALFVTISLLMMVKGMVQKPFYYLVAAVFSGLAHLTRLDGFLLAATLFLVILISKWSWRTRMVYLSLTAVLYLSILSPWLAANYNALGSLLPTAPAKLIWAQNHDDLFAYSRTLSLESYMDWGLDNIIRSKLVASFQNLRTMYKHLGGVLSVLIIFSAVQLIPQLKQPQHRLIYTPPFLFMGLLMMVQTGVGTITSAGSFFRSSHALLPFLIIISLNSLYYLLRKFFNDNQRLVNRQYFPVRSVHLFFIVFTLVFGIYFLVESDRSTRTLIQSNNQIGADLAILSNVISSQIVEEENPEVYMAAFPWEVNLATNQRVIVIPRDGLDSLFQAAHDYQVTYLLLPAPSPYLTGLYNGSETIDGLKFITNVPGTNMKLYRFTN